jgi:hypothetical protein
MDDNMKYSIDRIENDIAVLENIDTNEIIEIEISLLPENIKESNIVIYENNKYKLDQETEDSRKKDLLSRFSKLKKK